VKKLLPIILILTTFQTYAQFSIRRNPTNTNAVDILYTAPRQGQGVRPVQFFEFAIQVTNPNGALTATFTKGAPLASLTAPFGAKTGFTDRSGIQTFSWASTGVPVYANTYNFPATEVVLGTVSFSGNSTGAIVNAIDYQNAATYGGIGTEESIWSMQVDPFGTEVTNYDQLFYQSQPSGGTLGSLPPSTIAEQGANNQSLSLAPTPLPLKLLSFTATPQAGKTNTSLLNWTAAEQVNTSSFEIERSMDGNDYTQIGTLAAAGNFAGSKSYSFVDANAANGTNYYRLKMIDIDHNFTYSPVKAVNFDAGALSLQITPNPAQNVCYIKGLTQPAIVKLMDITGKVLLVQNGVTSTSPLNIASLARAVYLVQVIQNDQILNTLKLIKE